MHIESFRSSISWFVFCLIKNICFSSLIFIWFFCMVNFILGEDLLDSAAYGGGQNANGYNGSGGEAGGMNVGGYQQQGQHPSLYDHADIIDYGANNLGKIVNHLTDYN